MHIFLIKSYGKANRFGIGSYINMLIKALENDARHSLFVVHINTHHPWVCREQQGRVTHIYIPSPNGPYDEHNMQEEAYIDETFAHAIYTILADHFNEQERNIIHCNSLFEYNIACKAKENPSCYIVYTMHVILWDVLYKNDLMQFRNDWEKEAYNVNTLAIQLEMNICQTAHRVICLTRDAMAFADAWYRVPVANLRLVHNGIETGGRGTISAREKRALKEKYGLPGKVTVIYAGRLLLQKGLDIVIEALNDLHNQKIDFHFIVCGDGDLRYYLHKCSHFIGKVSFAGLVGKEMIYDLYRAADIGVLVSLIDQNSFSVLEMMDSGLPVIVTDNDSFAHLKGDHPGTVFVPLLPGNTVNLSILRQQLEELIQNASYRKQLGRHAQQLVRHRFSITHLRAQMEKLYFASELTCLRG